MLDVDAEFLGDEVAGAGIPTALGFVFNSSRHLDSYTEWEFEREELTIDWATEKIPKWTATAGNVSGVQMKTRFRERISRSIAARIRLAVIVLVWLAFLLLAYFVLISRYEEAAAIAFVNPPPLRLLLFVGAIVNVILTMLLFWRPGPIRQIRLLVVVSAVVFWFVTFAIMVSFMFSIVSGGDFFRRPFLDRRRGSGSTNPCSQWDGTTTADIHRWQESVNDSLKV